MGLKRGEEDGNDLKKTKAKRKKMHKYVLKYLYNLFRLSIPALLIFTILVNYLPEKCRYETYFLFFFYNLSFDR